jgi:AraC-like DNA-binding protein
MTARSDGYWELGSVPVIDRAEYFRSVVAETHLPWDLGASHHHDDRREYHARISRQRLGRLVVLECEADPCLGTRGERELEITEGEWLAVLMNLGGREVIEQNGRRVDMRPGSVLIWDGNRPAFFEVIQPLRKRTLLVPRPLIIELCGSLDDVSAVALEPFPITDLLRTFIGDLRGRWETLDPDGQAAGERAVLELLAAALTSHVGVSRATMHAALFARICASIDEGLADPGLRPPLIAAAHGISLRTLHTVFAEHGESVAGYIRRRRLERCREELLRPGPMSITDMAFRWGFTDSAHFSRTFKAEYGLSPRELRRAGVPCTEGQES